MGRKAKVTVEQVVEMRKYMNNPTFTKKEIMEQFDISYSLYQKILNKVVPYDDATLFPTPSDGGTTTNETVPVASQVL